MNPTVLAVDDNPDALLSHRKVMGKYGINSITAASIDEAESIITKNDIDCIHMDINLYNADEALDWNKQNGLSALSRFYKKYPSVPSMVISNYIFSAGAKSKAKELNIYDKVFFWYPKPADLEIVAFDTIKTINNVKFEKSKSDLMQYLGQFSVEETELLENALSSSPNFMHFIKLDREKILKKMLHLLLSIGINLEKKQKDEFHANLQLLRHLTISHLHDYFLTASASHQVLADHIFAVVEKIDSKDKKNITSYKIKALKQAVELQKRKILDEEEVYEARNLLEEAFDLRLGFRMKSQVDVDEYLMLLEEEE